MPNTTSRVTRTVRCAQRRAARHRLRRGRGARPARGRAPRACRSSAPVAQDVRNCGWLPGGRPAAPRRCDRAARGRVCLASAGARSGSNSGGRYGRSCRSERKVTDDAVSAGGRQIAEDGVDADAIPARHGQDRGIGAVARPGLTWPGRGRYRVLRPGPPDPRVWPVRRRVAAGLAGRRVPKHPRRRALLGLTVRP